MKCPRCQDETYVTVLKEEHIYPELFLGMPVFWRFMAPNVARAVTAGILVFGVVIVILALVWLFQGVWQLALMLGLLVALIAYVFVACLKALKQHQLKVHYKCGSCHLEWSGEQPE